MHNRPTRHTDPLAGDVLGRIRGEKGYRLGNIANGREATERNPGLQLADGLLSQLIIVGSILALAEVVLPLGVQPPRHTAFTVMPARANACEKPIRPNFDVQ